MAQEGTWRLCRGVLGFLLLFFPKDDTLYKIITLLPVRAERTEKRMLRLIPDIQQFTPADGKCDLSRLTLRGFPEGYAYGIDNASDGLPVRFFQTEMPAEGYRIDLKQDGIDVFAADGRGAYYAVVTLRQLKRFSDGAVDCGVIEDSPRCSYRGYMLDVGRYFFPVEDVCKLIDLISLYKINVLHLHLTEDQGWRVEIKRYPKLTEIGSKRRRTHIHLKPHEGFYTQEDLRFLVSYAKARAVEIMPEFDMPGHCTAAVAAYPDLACFPRSVGVAETFGVKFDVLCLAQDATFEFVRNVLDEMIEIFPYPMVHIGGDEVPTHRWELCPACRDLYAKSGVGNWLEYQARFMNRVSEYLRSKGKTAVMWNPPHSVKGLDPAIVWQFWTDELPAGVVEAELAAGRKMINSDSKGYYLDFLYGMTPLRKTYRTKPSFVEGKQGADSVIGIEGAMWTELVPDLRRAEYLTFPRLAAIAERAWSREEDFEGFSAAWDMHQRYLREKGVRTAPKRVYRSSIVQAIAHKIWWARRQLYWGGLRNLIDNKKIETEAKNMKQKGDRR